MDEKTDTGGAARKLGSSSVLPQDKGSKNKRKLDGPSLVNPVNVPFSMSEFPHYELHPEMFRCPVFGPLEVGSSWVPLREDFEPADWDDPIACQLEELLLSNLRTIFRNAIKKIVECGYKEGIAEKLCCSDSSFWMAHPCRHESTLTRVWDLCPIHRTWLEFPCNMAGHKINTRNSKEKVKTIKRKMEHHWSAADEAW
ncbi:hypothetical protein CRYUN_Cryun23aG0092800 [Craigia yunnanensis]